MLIPNSLNIPSPSKLKFILKRVVSEQFLNILAYALTL